VPYSTVFLNGIFYVLSTGCQWQALPKDLPPKGTGNVGKSETNVSFPLCNGGADFLKA
jgi:transposase